VPNAGLLPVAALAQRIDLGDLIDLRLRLAAEGAKSGAKALTVVGSMLAGGDSIDETPPSSALVPQVNCSTTHGLPRRPSAGCGAQVVQRPGARHDQPGATGPAVGGRCRPGRSGRALTIDLNSSIVPFYGRGKQGAAFGYTKVRGYHPQFATCAQTGMVLFSRLRGGPSPS
jgi:hypothetical protein